MSAIGNAYFVRVYFIGDAAKDYHCIDRAEAIGLMQAIADNAVMGQCVGLRRNGVIHSLINTKNLIHCEYWEYSNGKRVRDFDLCAS